MNESVWATIHANRDSSYVPSTVEHLGHLYWVSHKGEAYCLKADTWELVYKEKLNAGSDNSFYVSVTLADGKLYAPSRKSGIFVLAAKPEFKLIARDTFPADQSDFNGSAAISDGNIFLRSNEFLYCISND